MSFSPNYELEDVIDKNRSIMKKIAPKTMLEYFTNRIIGQEEELRLIVFYFYNYLTNIFSLNNYNPPSWLLTAPSGCGKTEIYRTLRDFCKDYDIRVPIVQIDLSQYTETGYNGKNSDEIMMALYRKDSLFNGIGFCFLDEADKTFIPSHNSFGEDCNAAAQSNLLMLIEGTEESIKVDRMKTVTMDSGKTMFILMGAFQELRKDKQLKCNKASKQIGFGKEDDKTDLSDVFYDDITLDDMIEYGMLEEIAGRMQMVINLHKLTHEDMTKVIISRIADLEKEICISVVFDDSVIRSFLEISYTNLGVRKIINCLKLLAYKAISKAIYERDINDNCCLIIESSEYAYLEFENDQDVGIQ